METNPSSPSYSRLEQTSLALSGVPAGQVSKFPQIRSKRWSIVFVIFTLLQGIIGALLLGWLLTETIRSVLLQDPNIPIIIGLLSLITFGGTIGTSSIIAVALISRPRLRWPALAGAVLLPILIEIIDIPLRLILMLQETLPLLI